MTAESDKDLPLHDEAMARSKWRGGETLLDTADAGTDGPASEVDDAAQGGGGGSADSGGGLPNDLARTPPD
jgi:hypothetical protein